MITSLRSLQPVKLLEASANTGWYQMCDTIRLTVEKSITSRNKYNAVVTLLSLHFCICGTLRSCLNLHAGSACHVQRRCGGQY